MKLYELLHMQLWRKGRVELEGHTVMIEGRPARPIRKWDIKSGSSNPYDYDSYWDLGLNQFFVGQDPKKPYDGDPSDDETGIYHDDCYIQPKTYTKLNLSIGNLFGKKEEPEESDLLKDIPAENPMTGWKWGTTNILGQELNVTRVDEYGMWGDKLVLSVTADDRGDKRFAVITYADGTVEEREISYEYTNPITNVTSIIKPEITYSTDLYNYAYTVTERVGSGQYPRTYYASGKTYVPLQSYIDLFGRVIYEADTEKKVIGLEATGWGGTACKFIVFQNGMSFYLMGASPKIINGEIKGRTAPIRSFSPLVYTDTGDLVMNKVLFIDYWDDFFELYVHEDVEWYKKFAAFVIIVVSFILAYITNFYFLVEIGISVATAIMVAFIAGFGAAMGTIGAITGNKTLQVIGMALSLGTAIYTGYVGFAYQGAAALGEEFAKQAAIEAAKNVTIQALAEYAFTEMLPEIFLQVFALYRLLKDNAEAYTPEAKAVEVKPNKTTVTEEEEEFSDPITLIAKQHEKILKL
jgi:hypothetical protein